MAIQDLNEFYKEVKERCGVEQPKRGFTGIWIPKEVWLNEDLSIQEKVMLAEIWSLDNEKGCVAGNSYFQDFFNMTKISVQRIIRTLIEKGFVSRGKFNGRVRVLHCNLRIVKKKRR